MEASKNTSGGIKMSPSPAQWNERTPAEQDAIVNAMAKQIVDKAAQYEAKQGKGSYKGETQDEKLFAAIKKEMSERGKDYNIKGPEVENSKSITPLQNKEKEKEKENQNKAKATPAAAPTPTPTSAPKPTPKPHR